ncbi:pyridoxamine 5-phosphate [Seminavis robusta]|uniref:Pyridoxamine 5-phosphate n=1 Tax=Seminavis robusta TaxID=568900 RepID=A0A9N8EZ63_9STRA|nr:pyridoxamine 5-phosphate [Seminavis robusta]|eukprot:Sro3039_g342640.1 pyridoxamine 5-phosphate (292) ;mRNA; f:7555-8430
MGYTVKFTIPSLPPGLVLSAAAVAGSVMLYLKLAATNRSSISPDAYHYDDDADDDEHTIRTLEQLRSVIPAGMSGSGMDNAVKVIDHIDDQMKEFLGHSNLCFLATMSPQQDDDDADDENATTSHLQVSPKGDPPGSLFHVAGPHKLLLPDRPGNRLLFGFQNLLTNPKIGLCAIVSGTNTTLRLGGTATLTKNPQLCQQLQVRGCPATLVLQIHVEYAFFHCAKSFIRGKVWDAGTGSHQKKVPVSFGPYIAPRGGQKLAGMVVDTIVEQEYSQLQKAVDGQQPEKAQGF